MSRELKSRLLFREIGNIDACYLAENEEKSREIPQQPGTSKHYLRWAMAAASFLVVIIAAGLLWNGLHPVRNEDTMSKEAAALANPYIECRTLQEAAGIAGFTISVPDSYEGADQFLIQAIKDQMIEVIYHDSTDAEVFRIRKGTGTEDISGDYTEYTQTVTRQSNGRTITLKGENDTFSVAVWSDGNYQYAIEMQEHPMSWDKIKELADQIQ